jgi:hypothetical protein
LCYYQLLLQFCKVLTKSFCIGDHFFYHTVQTKTIKT